MAVQAGSRIGSLKKAVALAVLRDPTPARVSFVLTFTIAALLTMTLRARFASRPEARAWAFGFSLLGWSCLVMSRSGWGDWLPTTIVIDELAQWLTTHFGPYPTPNGRGPWYTNAIHEANGQFLVGAIHLITLYFTLVIAILAGFLTQALAARLAEPSIGPAQGDSDYK